METQTMHKIAEIRFENNEMIIRMDSMLHRIPLDKISEKLLKASEAERNDYSISPSGYGIHWHRIDEDLAVAAMLKV